MAEPKHAKFAEHRMRWETASTLRRYLVAPCQEASYALIDMVVDCPVAALRVPWLK